MRVFPPLFAVLALAACGEPAPPAEPAPEPEPVPTLGGVNLSQPVLARGNEPFWSVEIGPEGLVHQGVDRPREVAPRGEVQLMGTVAVFSGMTDRNRELKVMLTETECSDGMSDLTYPLTARVEIGGETLNGCAASAAALAGAGESGPVVEPAAP